MPVEECVQRADHRCMQRVAGFRRVRGRMDPCHQTGAVEHLRVVESGSLPVATPKDDLQSVVVVFSLVAYRKNGDRLVVVDLEQRHVPGGAERNHQFAQKWVACGRLPVAER